MMVRQSHHEIEQKIREPLNKPLDYALINNDSQKVYLSQLQVDNLVSAILAALQPEGGQKNETLKEIKARIQQERGQAARELYQAMFGQPADSSASLTIKGELVENPHLYFGSPHTLRDIDSNTRHECFKAGSKAQHTADRLRTVGLPDKAEAVKYFCAREGCAWKTDNCSGDTCDHMAAIYDVFEWLKGKMITSEDMVELPSEDEFDKQARERIIPHLGQTMQAKLCGTEVKGKFIEERDISWMIGAFYRLLKKEGKDEVGK